FGGLKAVNNLDLTVDRGEILGLVGPNGSGKSTAMSLIMGVHRANAGRMLFDGADISRWSANRIARAGVAMVFQHARPLQQQTVLENVQLALLPDRILNLRHALQTRRAAEELTAMVGLSDVADRLPSELPYAGLRRLEFAQAMARRPKLLLLDEPFAGLSAGEVREFSTLIRELRGDARAIILVDHNVKSVRDLADRMLAMSAGSKIAEGTPEQTLANAEVRAVYLGEASDRRPPPAAPTEAAPDLDARDVIVRYGKATALHGVSLRVPAGSVTALVGLNGAGKTSLFNAICGLVAKQGEIVFQGDAITGWAPDAIARHGIVLCPETRELFGDMTVRENLQIGGNMLAAARLRERMEFVETLFPRLAERRRQAAATLSGGEQQQLAIGRALMMKPRLLLIDEPTLGLAPVILDVISEAIEALRASGDLSLLIAEQNITFALRHANTVHLLEHGEIAWSGDAAAFADDVGHRVL
ncbi:MAG: ATP-binding cassette domain-containing protein, partial [Acetobacteraceae bacterium]|nr:ATP-binding cassette domain-containing protein [Acetobacteraceae bacterium]